MFAEGLRFYVVPIVTKLTTQKKGEFINLYVDEEFYCGLNLNQVAAWRLRKGMELSGEQLLQLRAEAQSSKAYNAAIRYLALRIRSTQEIYDYLMRKGFDAAIDEILARLTHEGYLNDEDFARSWAEMRRQMLKSPRAIERELVRKGISKDIIAATVSDEGVDSSIEQLITKKNRHRTYDREHMMRYLVGRGFTYSQIKPHLDKVYLD